MSSLLSSRYILIKIAIICGLAACSPDFVSLPSSGVYSPSIEENIFISYDSTKLPLREWLPGQELDGVIIGLHGFNDYSNFLKDSVTLFNNRKLAVYAYDQRGFGETVTRGRWSGKNALSGDLNTFITLVNKRHHNVPVYILGDSMGGAVTVVAMVKEGSPKVDGVILVAPAVWARSEMPFYQRWLLWLASHTIPWKKVTGENIDITVSDNIEMLRELGRDPLVIKETRIDVLYGLSNLMDEAYRSAEHLKTNVLILYGGKDEIIPRKPVDEFYKRLPAGHQVQQIIFYENGYHMLMRDLQSEKVVQDIVDWIDGQNKQQAALR